MASILDAVRELGVSLRDRSTEIERDRDIPRDIIDELVTTGCLRMLVPHRFGGDDLPLPEVVDVIAELARADGAVGWCVSQYCAGQLIVAGFPPATLAEVYAAGPDAVIAGATAPKGRALRADGGWRISGRWPFASGSRHAAWCYLACVDGSADGPPTLRMALVPASATRIEDTWHAAGLAGTGSHDLVVRTQCADGWCEVIRPDGPAQTEQGSLFLAAVAVGIATRALDEIVALAGGGKRPAFSAQPLGESPLFRYGLGNADLTLAAARALLREQATELSRSTVDGRPLPPVHRARAYATAAGVTTLARQVATEAFGLAGGTAVYQSSALQRTLRDLHVAGQHFINGPTLVTKLGEALLAR